MYMDKLDGRIDAEFFDRQAAEWRTEQVHILRNIETHATANQNYIEEGIKLLQLARRAHELFENQPASEKRKLLDFVLSNSIWKNGKLLAEYRQPFDVLAVAIASDQRTRWLFIRNGGSPIPELIKHSWRNCFDQIRDRFRTARL